MAKMSIQDLVNKSKVPQKNISQISVKLLVSDGQISKNFFASMFNLSKLSSKKRYNLSVHMIGSSEKEQDVLKKTVRELQDDAIIVILKPFVGFPVDAIDKIINYASEHNVPCGLPVPFEKLCLESLKGKVVEDPKKAIKACGSFDISPDGPIVLDTYCMMKVKQYQDHDVVAIPVKYIEEKKVDISSGISGIKDSKLPLFTNFEMINNNTSASLLDRLMYVCKKKQ